MDGITRFGLAALAALAVSGAISPRSNAAEPATANPAVGNIIVCYYTPNCSFAIVASGLVDAVPHPERDSDHPASPVANSSAVVDAPAFEITNTGKVAMTSVRLTILADAKLGLLRDSFLIGTIEPRKSFVVIPGLSDDKAKHATNQFFYHSGSALDTSDSSPNDNAVAFEVTGIVSGRAVTTGKIVTGATIGPANDKTVAKLNFLGGPGNADGPCNDCFGPKLIGVIR